MIGCQSPRRGQVAAPGPLDEEVEAVLLEELNEYEPRAIASSSKRTPDAGTPWIRVSSNRPNW